MVKDESTLLLILMSLSIVILYLYRKKVAKDLYYSNSRCKYIIINKTKDFLDKPENTNMLRTLTEEQIIKKIVPHVASKEDRRVLLYYNNNKNNINRIIKKYVSMVRGSTQCKF